MNAVLDCMNRGAVVLRARRAQSGTALSEMGPALFILFIFAVFPVLDLIILGLSYCSCVTLNDLQLREAARVPRSQAISEKGSVQLAIPGQWRSSVMGGIAGLMEDPKTEVSYSKGDKRGNIYVTVSTTVVIKPLLTIPFFPKVPGLGSPLIVTISNNRLLENPVFVTY